jgi:hypothetical protein
VFLYSFFIDLPALSGHLLSDSGELIFCTFDELDEPAVVVLKLLGRLEAAGQLSVVVSARILLGASGQIDDPALVFRNSPIEPFQAVIDADDLFIPSGQFGRGLFLNRCRKTCKYLAGLLQPGDVAVSDLVGLGTQLGHSFREVPFGRQHSFELRKKSISGTGGPDQSMENP